jgi:hypothetical protein
MLLRLNRRRVQPSQPAPHEYTHAWNALRMVRAALRPHVRPGELMPAPDIPEDSLQKEGCALAAAITAAMTRLKQQEESLQKLREAARRAGASPARDDIPSIPAV